MNALKKKVKRENIEKKASSFYKKYNIPFVDTTKNDVLKANGNFKYIWDFKSESNTTITTSIY